MANHYVVTAHKPTAVTACVTGESRKASRNVDPTHACLFITSNTSEVFALFTPYIRLYSAFGLT